jgi:hypothetical protein
MLSGCVDVRVPVYMCECMHAGECVHVGKCVHVGECGSEWECVHRG